MKRKIFGYVFAFMAMLLWASLSDRVSFAADESKEGAPAAEAPKAEAPSAAPAAPAAAAPAPKLPPYFTATSRGSENARTLARSDGRCLWCVGNSSR